MTDDGVVVDVVFETGLLYLELANLSDRPALNVSCKFDPPLIDMQGRDVSSLVLFRRVEFLGRVSEESRRDLLAGCRAFLFPGEEDFGIAPLEAQALGTPVIAFGRGGSAETIRGLDAAAPTGVLFAEQTVASIRAAVAQFEASAPRITAAACRANAERFSRQTFNERFPAYVADALTQHRARSAA